MQFAATDGVGTKVKIAIETACTGGRGIDFVAMSLNDLVVQGAEPPFFLDYFAYGKLHPEAAANIVAGIAEGCRGSGCALIGGEAAEQFELSHGAKPRRPPRRQRTSDHRISAMGMIVYARPDRWIT